MDFDEITDQALAIAGGGPTDAQSMRVARRAFNLLTLDLGNRGVNLWQEYETTQTLVAATADYTLGADVLDVLDVSFRDDTSGSDIDTLMGRLSASDYAAITDKALAGRPTSYRVRRTVTGPVLTVWPVPDSTTAEELSIRCFRRTEDVGSFAENVAMPARFLPAIVAGMAHEMAQARAHVVDPARRQELKADYEAKLGRAMAEDRERVPTVIMPDMSPYYRL